MGEYEGSRTDRVEVRVWDRPTRLFHWALVFCLAGSWITGDQGMLDWHERFGLTALALVVFRLVWGVVGGEFARFSSFVRGPGAVFRYLRSTAAGRHPEHAGHNPLGALAVVALLLLVGIQATLGLFASDDILYEGPLYHLAGYDLSSTLTGWHHRIFDLLLIVVIVHVAAVFAYAIFLRDDLIMPMVTGTKLLKLEDAPSQVRRTPWWVAAIVFVLTAAAAYAITLLG